MTDSTDTEALIEETRGWANSKEGWHAYEHKLGTRVADALEAQAKRITHLERFDWLKDCKEQVARVEAERDAIAAVVGEVKVYADALGAGNVDVLKSVARSLDALLAPASTRGE